MSFHTTHNKRTHTRTHTHNTHNTHPHTHAHTHTHTHTVSGLAVGVGFVLAALGIIFVLLYYLMPEDFPRLIMDWLSMLAGGASWWD